LLNDKSGGDLGEVEQSYEDQVNRQPHPRG
jgi:hypothetical protein